MRGRAEGGPAFAADHRTARAPGMLSGTMARPSNLSRIPTAQIHAELRRRQRDVAALLARREALARKLAFFDELLHGTSAQPAPTPNGAVGRRRRAVNAVSLPQALHAALKGKTLSVTEAADAVLKSGYKTHSKSFRIQVNIALTKHPELFKRVERGRYTAK